jgi:hypothetical protein
MTNLTLLLVVLVPYIMYAVYYFYTRSNSGWYIDLAGKKFILGSIGVPFYMISHFNIKKANNWQLYIETKDQKRLMLFADESKDKIHEAGAFLSKVTGSKLY